MEASEAVENKKRCSVCREIKAWSAFHMRSDRPRPASMCMECKSKKHQEKYKDSNFRKICIDRSKKWQNENPLQARYLIAKSLATNPKRRQAREFALTVEQCNELWSKGCHYCQQDISSFKGMGLDRKDNSLGYTADNVLPCCGDCNKVRNTVLTVEEMEVAMKAVLVFRSGK